MAEATEEVVEGTKVVAEVTSVEAEATRAEAAAVDTAVSRELFDSSLGLFTPCSGAY